MDSLKKRFVYKVVGAVFSAASGGVFHSLVLRTLGPAGYGSFNFLNAFFIQVRTFLDMGTGNGFYTKLSKRPQEIELVVFYFIFIGASCLAILGLTLLACASPFSGFIWPGQQVRHIIMAAGVGALTWISSVLYSRTDAYGLTVQAEIVGGIQKTGGLVLIVLMVFTHQLTLTSFFGFWYVLTIFAITCFLGINARHGHPLPANLRLSPAKFKSYASEFYHYSHPLAAYGVVAFITSMLGRWLLQHFSGSVEQGYFGLSYQISTLCVLGVTAMTPLLMREFSILHQRVNIPEMASLFSKYIPMIYSLTAYFACFIALQADIIVRILGGSGYSEASTVMMLMSLSSIHQTYDMLGGSVFLATGRTGLYRNIGISTMLAGLVMNYFLLAPASAGGLHLGATGLAVTTLVIKFVGVNIQLYLNTKFLGLPFRRYLGHQIVSVAALLALAYLSRSLANVLIGPDGPLWLAGFVLSGIFYSAAVGAIALVWPKIFGLKPGQFASTIRGLGAKFEGAAG